MGSMLVTALLALLVAVGGLLAGLVFLGVDRILVARMQARIGPPWRQPFDDVFKLMTKENVEPREAVRGLFHAAPVVALAASIVPLFYLPIGAWGPLLGGHGDLILVVYLLTVPALAMVVGGFASSSPYATIGAQREMVTMIAYELPLVTIAVALAWTLADAGVAQPFALGTIVANPIWGVVGPVGAAGAFLLFLVLLAVTPAELARIPFDTPEAETEIAGGLLVEYSGRNFALFYMALGVKSIVMAALVVALFFPYPLASFLPLWSPLSWLFELAFWLLKVELVILVAATLIRASMARLRITQVVSVYWKYLGSVGLVGLGLLMLDAGMR